MKDDARGYSIWLAPEKVPRQLGDKFIRKFSKKFHTPIFSPHVTLLGNIEQSEEKVIAGTHYLSKQIRSCRIYFYKIGYQDFFLRSIYLKARSTPSLMKMHKKAKKIFGARDNSNYFPHMSLIYGNIPKESKINIISKYIIDPHEFNFRVQELQVFRTIGTIKEWKKIASFNLY